MFFTRWIDSFRLRPRRPAAVRCARRPARRRARHRLAFIEALESRTLLSAAPVVASFELYNDSGTPGDYTTNDPLLTGAVTDDVSASGLEVQIDFDGDGFADDSTWTDTDGTFMYDPSTMLGGLGTYTVAARAGEYDMMTMETVYGGWVSLTFTWDDDPAEVETFELLNNVGTEFYPETVDGIVTGSLTNSDGSVEGINVEFDFDGDGMADDYTLTDSAGEFTHDLSAMIGYGQQTVYARGAEYVTSACQTVYGGWVSLSFNYIAPPVITDFGAIDQGNGWWLFEGTVDYVRPMAVTVTLGGVAEGHQASVDENGYFSNAFQVYESGTATAVASDEFGRNSEEAMCWAGF